MIAVPVATRVLIPLLVRFLASPPGRGVTIVVTKGAPRIPVIGKLIPIGAAHEMTDQAAERALKRKPDEKVRKRKEFNDNSHVITLEILKEILEEQCGEGRLILDSATSAITSLVTEFAGVADVQSDWNFKAGGQIANKIMEAARDRVLSQSAARKRVTYRYSKRVI
jgi:hypothetical protein